MNQPQAPPSQFPILLSTVNDLPGYQVVRVYGEVSQEAMAHGADDAQSQGQVQGQTPQVQR